MRIKETFRAFNSLFALVSIIGLVVAMIYCVITGRFERANFCLLVLILAKPLF